MTSQYFASHKDLPEDVNGDVLDGENCDCDWGRGDGKPLL